MLLPRFSLIVAQPLSSVLGKYLEIYEYMQDFRIEVVGDKKQSFLSLLKELQLIVNDSIEVVVNHFNEAHLSKSVGVAVIILKRLIESTKSGELLISSEFYRDASILVTNQIELRLDLQYITQDRTRAETWLAHTNEYRKPWKVSFLFEKLFEGNGKKGGRWF